MYNVWDVTSKEVSKNVYTIIFQKSFITGFMIIKFSARFYSFRTYTTSFSYFYNQDFLRVSNSKWNLFYKRYSSCFLTVLLDLRLKKPLKVLCMTEIFQKKSRYLLCSYYSFEMF